jgi:hypothetical protein
MEVRVDVVMEESPEYESKSNGEIERAIQMVQGQFRAMKDRLESRYGQRISGEHPCVPWLMAHSSDTINRYHVYKDGRTAYANWKGRQFRGQYREFGEGALYLRANSKGKEKFDSRWENGIWLGIADRTGEVIIGTKEGVLESEDCVTIQTMTKLLQRQLFKSKRYYIQFQKTSGKTYSEIMLKLHFTLTVQLKLKNMSTIDNLS